MVVLEGTFELYDNIDLGSNDSVEDTKVKEEIVFVDDKIDFEKSGKFDMFLEVSVKNEVVEENIIEEKCENL